MSDVRYSNFDLLIDGSEDGYRARVIASPVGQSEHQFALPFHEAELRSFFWLPGHVRRALRHLRPVQSDTEPLDPEGFGKRLFDAVFADQVRDQFVRSLDRAQEGRLRIRLRLSDVPELAALPWEYLYATALNKGFLALSEKTPIVRYLDLPQPNHGLVVSPPLQILVVVSDPSNVPALKVEEEWRRLCEAVDDLQKRGLIVLERLPEATLPALRQRLRRRRQQGDVHVFHFIGHGRFDPEDADGSGLVFEDNAGRSLIVRAGTLANSLRDHDPLRLAFLNACEGARDARTEPFTGVAQKLVEQGTPAVLAMQFEVSDAAAIALAREFYAALADGYAVDAALAEARKAIFDRSKDVEWGTPVLFMRSPDGVLWREKIAAVGQKPEAHLGAGVRSGGVNFYAPAYIQGDVIGQDQYKAVTQVPTAEEHVEIERLFNEIREQLDSLDIPESKKLMGQEFVGQLEQELTKTDEPPAANMIKFAGDWLLKNVPALAGALSGLFTNPIVGKVVEAAGDLAANWVKQRFTDKSGDLSQTRSRSSDSSGAQVTPRESSAKTFTV